jgi:4-hydroxy-3-polyprenylbenzoate decarboxylase
MYTKLIIVVDEDVVPSDTSTVALRAFNNIDAKRDFVFSDGPLDALDHSSPLPKFGTRLGIDATRKGPEEGHLRPWPDPLKMEKRIVDLVDKRWKEYGL